MLGSAVVALPAATPPTFPILGTLPISTATPPRLRRRHRDAKRHDTKERQ